MIVRERDYYTNKRFVSTVRKGILLADGWTSECPYKQTVFIEGITYANTVDIVLDENMAKEEMVAFHRAIIASETQGIHCITVKAYGMKPTINLPFLAVITGGQESCVANVSA